MTLRYLIISCLLTCRFIYGQDVIKVRREKSEAFTLSFRSKNVRYPLQALNNGIEGKVIMLFDIDSTCVIINRRVEKGLGYGCDEAALKILDEHEADLKAAHRAGCPVVKNYMMPVTFKMK